MKKNILLSIAILLCTIAAHAQLGQCNSSYSRFGLGLLSEHSQGFNTSMAGVGIGINKGNILNYTNPASYAAIDSLSFILDAGMSISMGNMKQGQLAENFRNAHLDYVSIGFRLRRRLGVSLGFMPYSRVGYSFMKEAIIVNDPATMNKITSVSAYGGEGGLHQVYVGLGWNPIDKLSVGFNAGFLWGSCDHTMAQTFYENDATSSSFSPLTAIHDAKLSTYTIDLGAQYPVRLTKYDILGVGATVGIGHRVNSDATLARNAGTTETPLFTATEPYDLPFTYGLGVALQHKRYLMVALDGKYERWSTCHTPVWDENTDDFAAGLGEYKDRIKLAAGAQYTPDAMDKHYWRRIQYRAGLQYSTPYLIINGQNGPREIGATLGVALPIMNNYNSRSTVNVGFKYMHRAASAPGMITENYFMCTVGLTFNEMWFMKYRIK